MTLRTFVATVHAINPANSKHDRKNDYKLTVEAFTLAEARDAAVLARTGFCDQVISVKEIR